MIASPCSIVSEGIMFLDRDSRKMYGTTSLKICRKGRDIEEATREIRLGSEKSSCVG